MSAADDMLSLLDRGPVMPVLVIDRLEDAAPLARALVAGGLTVLEVTLRTPAALDAIAEMAAAAPEAIIGAGTIRTPDDVAAAQAAGAAFGVSPGSTPFLLDAVRAADWPFLPGGATPSEVMTLAERGFRVVKFFPAEAAGGAAYLTALASPLPDLRFCPTGGVSPDNAPTYLALDAVSCVGGSWVAPKALIEAASWDEISERARAATTLAAP